MGGITPIEQNYPYLLGKLGAITTGAVNHKRNPMIEGGYPAGEYQGAPATNLESKVGTSNQYVNIMGREGYAARKLDYLG